MRILIGISHPKHVYMFKNPIKSFVKKGHEVKVVAVEKEITEYLLKQFEIPYTLIGENQPTLYRKILALPKWEYLTYKIAKEFKPDIFIGRAIPHLAHVSALLNRPFIIFEDTEVAKALHKITLPFANAIVTPNCYEDNLGKKHIRFNGYFELAYLHPNYFKPDPSVLDEIGVNSGDKFTILRSVSWNASHDLGDKGFRDIIAVVRYLERYCKILITSENKLPSQLEKYRVTVAPERIHHLLHFANLYIGESATMACESAILGTPSIVVSTSRRGYTNELEDEYGMVFNYSDSKTMEKQALKKSSELLADENVKKIWEKKRRRMLSEKIDVTKFIVNAIENYRDDFYKYTKSEK